MESLIVGALLRLAEACTQAAPTVLVGLLTAGVLHRMLGARATRAVFGGSEWRALLQAWLAGMLLPVCSLGVLPVAREARRVGAPTGAVLALALTAPLFNPLSLLYGLTLSRPITILSFALASLVVVALLGAAWDWFFGDASTPPAETAPVAEGPKRLLAVAVFAAREAAGPSLGLMAVGLAGVALLGVALPAGALQSAMEHDNPAAPLVMAGVALPAYVTPMTAMAQLGSMFQHGNSVGAAFALLVLGAGLNLGLLAWVGLAFPWRRGLLWLCGLLAITLGLGYALEGPLFPRDVEPAGHTHAFDGYCAPFPFAQPNAAEAAWRRFTQNAQTYELVSLAGWLALAAGGAALRRWDPLRRVEAWLESAPERRLKYDVPVPAPVLGVVALAGLVLFSLLGCYVYYPAPEATLREMVYVKTDVIHAANTGNRAAAEHWIPKLEDWNRRLQVGVYLRRGELTEYHRYKARALADKLELLEHALEENDRDEIREYSRAVEQAHRRLQRAFSQEL